MRLIAGRRAAAGLLALTCCTLTGCAGSAGRAGPTQAGSGTAALSGAARCALPETPGTPSALSGSASESAPAATGRPPADPVRVTIVWYPGLHHRGPCAEPAVQGGRAVARRLIADIRAARAAPSGRISCPADMGRGAELFFTYPDHSIVAATADFTGCGALTTVGRQLRPGRLPADLRPLAPAGFPRF